MRTLWIVFLLFWGQLALAQVHSTPFRNLDRNGDGVLTVEELPVGVRPNFGRIDRDGDGKISPQEDTAFRNRRGARTPSAGPTLPEGVRVLNDVAYLENGHERQVLDLYLPKSTGQVRPVVIWVHGGGWQTGDKSGGPWRPLLEQGFAVASINYRLSQHSIFPAQINDCKAAVRWLRDHAAEYELDPQCFGVWGSSAGGHLVALLGTSGDVADLEGAESKTSSRVQAVCDWFGPTDFLKMNEHGGPNGRIDHDAPNSPEARLIGGAVQSHQEAARRASPLTYVTADDPPFLIVHGDQDPVVGMQQSLLLHKALTAAKVPSTLTIVPGAGHGQFRDPKIAESCIEFFERVLKNPPPKPAN